MANSSGPFRDLTEQFRARQINRRTFMQAATALGVSTSVASLVATSVSAQNATPAASTPEGRPADGTENQQRGAGDELRLLSYQASGVLAAHSGQGGKDFYPAALVSESPLIYNAAGELLPNLVEAVPTVENGLLSEDLLTATFTFPSGLTWSDGEPVTANDLVFTWKWVTHPDNASVNSGIWDTIESITAEDDLTAVVQFKSARVNWFDPFVGVSQGSLYPAHVFGDDPTNRNEAFLSNPIGTGPYIVETFMPNDVATFVPNPNYREPNKPYFSRVSLKGGGDAIGTGRAVVQSGEADYAWNVQAEPELIREMNANGEYGELVGAQTTNVEIIYLNFSDPNTEVDGQRSQKDTPHPILTDPAVREAIHLGIDRALIAREFYGQEDSATPNVLAGNDVFTSPNTSWTFDLEKAAQVLENAGWVLDGDVRQKDGVKLSLNYVAAVNSVRQKTQAVVQASLQSIGFEIRLDQVDSSVFFDNSAGNDQNTSHFYNDMMMWSNGSGSAISPGFMLSWYTGPDGENIAQKENDWTGQNFQRYQNPEFDALFDQLRVATTQNEAIDLMISLNDLVIMDHAVVPLVARVFYYGISNRLNRVNMDLGNNWVGPYDNIANWNENVE